MSAVSFIAVALTSSLLGAGPDVSIPFTKYTLPSNGLEVILSEDHTLPIVAVNIWYHAGPINEAPKRTGFAHLFEHLMFQGSKHVGDDQHFKLLESRGATHMNGTTSYDRTNYFETVPANDIELALWLESDRMGFLLDTFDQAKLDNQRQVVMNEKRQSFDNAPYGPSRVALVQSLFDADHPYYGAVIGSMDDLEAAKLEDVKDFYTRYYAPSNATLVLAGDFDTATIKGLIDKYFSTLERRPSPPKRDITTKNIDHERRLTVPEPVALPRITMAWHSPAAFAKGDADADVLSNILGGGKTSRLYRKLVYELQLAEGVAAMQESQSLVSTFVVLVTLNADSDLKKVESELQKVLDDVRAHPPTQQEIDQARNILLTQMTGSLQDVGGFTGKADMLNRYNQYTGDPGFIAHDLQRYSEVTPKSVHEFAKDLLDPAHRAVVVTVPKT